jgi:hypothetical protein
VAVVEVDKLVKRYKGAQTNAGDGVSFQARVYNAPAETMRLDH